MMLFKVTTTDVDRLGGCVQRTDFPLSTTHNELSSVTIRFVGNVQAIRTFTARSFRHRQFCGTSSRIRTTAVGTIVQCTSIHPVTRALTDVVLVNVVILNVAVCIPENDLRVSTLLAFVFVLIEVAPTIRRVDNHFTSLDGLRNTVRGVRGFLEASGGPCLRGKRHSFTNLRGSVRFVTISFNCAPRRPILRSVALTVPGKGAVTLINTSKTNGSALTSLVTQFCSPARKGVLLSKLSLQRFSVDSMHREVTVIDRRAFVFGAAMHGGVTCKLDRIESRRICRTTHLTGTLRFVRSLPRGLRAILNSHKIELSNKRHRQVTVTETLLEGPRVLVLSRTADTLSSMSRQLVRRSLRGLSLNEAIVAVTRHLSAVERTSGIMMVRRKGVIRRNACERLLSLRNNL